MGGITLISDIWVCVCLPAGLTVVLQGDDAEAAGTPGSGGGMGNGNGGADAQVENWDEDEADHFMCPISLAIMKEPVRFQM